jgi:hypothetical protein
MKANIWALTFPIYVHNLISKIHHPYSSINYHKFSLKINEIIHQKWSFYILKVKFGMLIEVA